MLVARLVQQRAGGTQAHFEHQQRGARIAGHALRQGGVRGRAGGQGLARVQDQVRVRVQAQRQQAINAIEAAGPEAQVGLKVQGPFRQTGKVRQELGVTGAPQKHYELPLGLR